MTYSEEHATRALEIIENLSPLVSHRPEYDELIAILLDSSRWHEAHSLFDQIRMSITLPFEREKISGLDSLFVYVAENAAKTVYNCSGSLAPFDEDSFEWLLKCERQFLEEVGRQSKI